MYSLFVSLPKNIYIYKHLEQHQVANKYISFNKTKVLNICGLNLKSNSENMLAFELISRAHWFIRFHDI